MSDPTLSLDLSQSVVKDTLPANATVSRRILWLLALTGDWFTIEDLAERCKTKADGTLRADIVVGKNLCTIANEGYLLRMRVFESSEVDFETGKAHGHPKGAVQVSLIGKIASDLRASLGIEFGVSGAQVNLNARTNDSFVRLTMATQNSLGLAKILDPALTYLGAKQPEKFPIGEFRKVLRAKPVPLRIFNVVGPLGCGKSAFLRECSRLAKQESMQVKPLPVPKEIEAVTGLSIRKTDSAEQSRLDSFLDVLESAALRDARIVWLVGSYQPLKIPREKWAGQHLCILPARTLTLKESTEGLAQLLPGRPRISSIRQALFLGCTGVKERFPRKNVRGFGPADLDKMCELTAVFEPDSKGEKIIPPYPSPPLAPEPSRSSGQSTSKRRIDAGIHPKRLEAILDFFNGPDEDLDWLGRLYDYREDFVHDLVCEALVRRPDHPCWRRVAATVGIRSLRFEDGRAFQGKAPKCEALSHFAGLQELELAHKPEGNLVLLRALNSVRKAVLPHIPPEALAKILLGWEELVHLTLPATSCTDEVLGSLSELRKLVHLELRGKTVTTFSAPFPDNLREILAEDIELAQLVPYLKKSLPEEDPLDISARLTVDADNSLVALRDVQVARLRITEINNQPPSLSAFEAAAPSYLILPASVGEAFRAAVESVLDPLADVHLG